MSGGSERFTTESSDTIVETCVLQDYQCAIRRAGTSLPGGRSTTYYYLQTRGWGIYLGERRNDSIRTFR